MGKNEYAGRALKVNGSIMPGTYTKSLYSTNPAFFMPAIDSSLWSNSLPIIHLEKYYRF